MKKNEQNVSEKKARLVIDIEDLREIAAKKDAEKDAPANVRVSGAGTTIMCPW
jgi:hypothetical protein